MQAGDIVGLYGVPVHACVATAQMGGAPLATEEAVRVARALPARRAEYARGRAAAREALTLLGVATGPLPSAPDRAPVWPEGVVGSISHCEGFCAAVVAKLEHAGGLGFDAEPDAPLPPGVADYVCTPQDTPALWSPRLREALTWPKLVFSAKEAVFKCQHPRFRLPLDFPDVAITFLAEDGPQHGRFHAHLEPGRHRPETGRFQGSWRALHGLLLTAVWMAPEPCRAQALGRSV